MKTFKVKKIVQNLNDRSSEIKYFIFMIFFVLGSIILFQPKKVYNYEGSIESYNNTIYNYEISFLSNDSLLVSLNKGVNGTGVDLSSTRIFNMLKLDNSTFLLSAENKEKGVNADGFDPIFNDLAKVSFYRYPKVERLVIKTGSKYAFFKQIKNE